jgi:hypothetical protein
VSYYLWKFKHIEFLIKLITYSVLIFSSNSLLLYQALRLHLKRSKLEISIIIWIIIRLISEVVSYVVVFKFGLSANPILHISDLILGLVFIWYFLDIRQQTKKSHWIFLIPVLYFYVELKCSGSINELKGISYMSYNIMCSLLMLRLLLKFENINEFSKPIVKALFIIHSVSFFYSMLEHIVRENDDLMQIVYPVFLFSQVIFNVFISYYLWSIRKS